MIADKKIDRMVLIVEVEGKCYSIIITKETQDAILSFD